MIRVEADIYVRYGGPVKLLWWQAWVKALGDDGEIEWMPGVQEVR